MYNKIYQKNHNFCCFLPDDSSSSSGSDSDDSPGSVGGTCGISEMMKVNR